MKDLVGKPLDKELIRRRLSSLYALDRFESIDYTLVEEERSRRPRARPAPQELGSELRARRPQSRGRFRGQQPLQRGRCASSPPSSTRSAANGSPTCRSATTRSSSPSSISRCRWRAATSSRRSSTSRSAASSGSQGERPYRRVPRAHGHAAASTSAASCRTGARSASACGAGTGRSRVLIGDPTLPTDAVRSRRLLRALLVRQARQHLLSAPRPAVRVRMARRARADRRRRELRCVRELVAGGAFFRPPHAHLLGRRGHDHRRAARRRRIRSRSAAS